MSTNNGGYQFQAGNPNMMGSGGRGMNGKNGVFSNGVFVGGGNPQKQLYEPFKPVGPDLDPQVKEMQKSTEDKDYYILYYNLEYEEYKYAKFTGRYDAYFGLERILQSESVDLEASFVLVETVGYSAEKKPRRFLTHPENAINLIEFAHAMEKFFGDNAWSIEEFITGYTTLQPEEKDAPQQLAANEQSTMTYEDLSAAMGKSAISGMQFSPTEKPVGGEVLDYSQSLFMSQEQRTELGDVFKPTNLLGVHGEEI